MKPLRGNVVAGWIVGIAIVLGLFFLFGGSDNTEISNSQVDSDSSYSGYTEQVGTYVKPYHYDNSYQYSYRTGYSGSQEYNYDVSGSGNSGYVYGNIDTEDKYGEGYLYDEDGNELHVETEWVDYGVMEATDEYGNTYELEVD